MKQGGVYRWTSLTKAWTSWMMGSWPSGLPLEPGPVALGWLEAGDEGDPRRKCRYKADRSVLWNEGGGDV